MTSERTRGVNISIVISNYDSKGHLLACVDSALSQVDAGEFEVIVPLHGTITAAELAGLESRAAETRRLRLLKPEFDNRAVALNQAVQAAASDRLVFLESHVLAPPDLAAHYGRILESPAVAAAQGAYAAQQSANWVSDAETAARASAGSRRRTHGLSGEEFHIHSAGFRRDALLAAGGFDTRVPGIAEVPLLQRISEGTGRIARVETPEVLHINHDDMRAYVTALHRRAADVGRLWQVDPNIAARAYPAAILQRHGVLVRAWHRPLGLAFETQLLLARAVNRLALAGRCRHLALAAAMVAVTAAVRAGFLHGYGDTRRASPSPAPGRGYAPPAGTSSRPAAHHVRILFQTRPDHVTRPGGDGIVIEALRDRLVALGFQVDLSSDTAPDLSDYAAVHLFNLELMPDTFLQAENARRWNRPFFLTPIYWTPEEAIPWQGCCFPENIARRLLRGRAFDLLALGAATRRHPHAIRALRQLPSLCRQRLRESILMQAATVFASCQAERQRLLRDFPRLKDRRIVVARFGYRPAPPSTATVAVPEPGYFLCVGAFGPRKNQLNLARALRDVPGARLVFVGAATAVNSLYYRAVRAAAPPDTIILPNQPHGALPALYAGARAVVQTSYIELPGLVAMEALAHGRPVVVADRAPVRECFEGLASFADPGSPPSIRQACLAASPPDPSHLAQFVAHHAWSDVARPVEEAYSAFLRSLRDGAGSADKEPKGNTIV